MGAGMAALGTGAAGAGLGAGGAGTGFVLGRVNNGGSGGGPTIPNQMASAFGLRSWRGGVMGGGVGLWSRVGGVAGGLGERIGDAGRVLDDDPRAITNGGVGGEEARSGSRTVRTSG